MRKLIWLGLVAAVPVVAIAACGEDKAGDTGSDSGSGEDGSTRDLTDAGVDGSRTDAGMDASSTGGTGGSGGTGGTGGTGGAGGSGGTDGDTEDPCGNGNIDLGEACDGANLAAQTCTSATTGALPAGSLTCATDCTLDTSDCHSDEPCGNGTIDVGEACDGINLAGQNCAGATAGALPIGSLACTASCALDTSGCEAPEEGDGGACGGPVDHGLCEGYVEGTYAMHVVLDVHWGKSPAENPLPTLDSGRGSLDLYFMATVDGTCPDGTDGIATLRPCGLTYPLIFSDVTCNAYQIEVPTTVWDSASIPAFTTTAMTSGFDVGDVLSVAKATGLLGISLTDPAGAWPTPVEATSFACAAGTGVDCYPDHDADGKPGVTFKVRNDGAQALPDGCGGFNQPFVYQAYPTETLGGVGYNPATRTATLRLGTRLSMGGTATIGECSATAAAQGAAQADQPDQRVYSCLTAAGSECSGAAAQHVDETFPEYAILGQGEAPPTDLVKPRSQGMLDQTSSQGPRTRMIRIGNVGDTFTCTDVRNAAFPAWSPALYRSPDYH